MKNQNGALIRKQIFLFIKQFREEKGFSPSLREIGEHIGYSSPSSPHRYVHMMLKEGLLKKDPDDIHRSLVPGAENKK